MQISICQDTQDCYFGDYPTLARIKRDYGNGADAYWLIPQITNLCLFCGCRDKLSDLQYRETAQLIATNYYYLKISEVMLFLNQFKAARYGRFYGSIDPMIIMTAIKDFADERCIILDRHEKQENLRRMELERKQNSISYEEYKRNMANGKYPNLAKIAKNASESPKRD